MTNFQIITDYNLNTPWILTDATLTDMAVGKLASLGSDQGSQLRAQTQVLQQQVADMEFLRNLMPKFSESAFAPITVNATTNTLKVGASWDISDLANAFPNRTLPSDPSDRSIQRLIDFFNGINQLYIDMRSTTRLDPNYFRITYKDNPEDLTTKVIVSTRPPGYDEQLGKYYVLDNNNQRQYIVLVKNEPFAVPINSNEYQNWLTLAALTRDTAVNQLFSQYQLTPVAGETIQWQFVTAGGATGSQFFGGLPVTTTNIELETEVGKIVQTGDGKYYRIKTPFVFGQSLATYEQITPVTPLTKPLLFAPTADTLRDIRGKFSEAALQVTQRNASQQLLVNSLLVSYTYHFDAAANVLKAFSDLRNRLAGNL